MTPYYEDDYVTLYHGDAAEQLSALPAGSADCIVTSPPYFGLRDYGHEGQYGRENSPVEYVETMRAVFAEARRVLADDGTLWLNLGDSYYSGRGASGADWVRPKSLLGIPWRVAFALQDDGWILRNDVIWHKPNAMPESVADRVSTRHEHVFLFGKSRRYHFDLDAVREDATTGFNGSEFHTGKTGEHQLGRSSKQPRSGGNKKNGGATYSGKEYVPTGTRNPGDVWSIPTQPFPGAHFACMPPKLAERCILAGCKPGGVVLDPFSGSGTTGMVAGRLGRRYIGIDLNADYLDLSLQTRLGQVAILDGDAS